MDCELFSLCVAGLHDCDLIGGMCINVGTTSFRCQVSYCMLVVTKTMDYSIVIVF